MAIKKKTEYLLDSSAIIYMALLQIRMSNVFRVSVNLKEDVDLQILQETVDVLTPRFPSMIAGIRSGSFDYWVVPVSEPPKVMQETKPLTYMSRKEIRKCALRVLYKNKTIAVEIFHGVADGRASSVFLKALIAEYLKRKHGVECNEDDKIILPSMPILEEEVSDSFRTYSRKKRRPFFHYDSYRFLTVKRLTDIHIVSVIFDTKSLLEVAHKYGTTLTLFLGAVMLESVMQIQNQSKRPRKKLKPVHLMVPIDLRTQFPSRTLRNFALQGYLSMYPENIDMPFEELLKILSSDIQRQFSYETLSSLITETVVMQKYVKWIPLGIKSLAVMCTLNFVEENTSALFFSNLGELQLPEKLKPFIDDVEFTLTPRTCSPYNCGIVSFDNKLRINISVSGESHGLEHTFLQKLYNLGCVPKVEVDGEPVDLDDFLNK